MKGWAAENFSKEKKKRENYISVLENNYCVSLSENFWHLFALFWTSAENNWFPYSTYLGLWEWKGAERRPASVPRAGQQPQLVSLKPAWTQYWDTVAAGLGLMLKVICRARRKGDKGAGFAAFFTCTNTHARTHIDRYFLSIIYSPSSHHWRLSVRTQKAVWSLLSPWKISDNTQCLPRNPSLLLSIVFKEFW